MFSRPRFSDWRISGSAGLTVSVETPVVNLSVGASYLQLPLENTRTNEKLTLHLAGGGAGLGVGLSLFGVVDVEGSLSAFPSNGIGRVLMGPRANGQLRRNDFSGNRVMAVSAGAKAAGGGSIVALAFISNSLWTRIATAAVPGPGDDLLWSHAGGAFWGASVGAGASAGVSYYEYVVANVS